MKILIISGFLGSGKTTFIQELAKRSKYQFAIMENEYGALNIDSKILNDSDVYEFSSGCICCSMQSDFTQSVLTIANSVDLDYLVVEPTGVGLLGNILDSLSRIEYDGLNILEPITIVDAKNFDKQHKEFTEICENQIKFSKQIILSKHEDFSQNQIDILIEKIKAINPNCEINKNHYSSFEDEWFNKLFERHLNSKYNKEDVTKCNLSTLSFENVYFNTPEECSTVISSILNSRFGNIARGKGFLKVADKIFKVDIVASDMTICEVEPKNYTSQFVLIGNDLAVDELNILFNYYKR